MNDNTFNKQKHNLEYHAVLSFIAEYNRTRKRHIHFICQCEPPMPDTLCRLGDKQIGVEVAHTYGTGEEAATRLGNLDMKDFPDKVHRGRRIIPISIRALRSLNDILAKKANAKYQFSPTWLLVRNGFFHFSLTDYCKSKGEILVPHGHPFEKIWLLCDERSIGPKGMMRLH
ncbi:MAG TPA: hypothetical protein VEF34_18220 [Syntrophobacteraceae bacterium]|nr:hypothetical protein [Syntrophobacteraceae bacterium]